MKTIAVSIDVPTLRAVDRRRKQARTSRSEVVRQALREYLVRREQAEWEERDRRAYDKHYKLINRQAAAQIAEQAKL